MRLFDPQSVKLLKEQARFFGGLVGRVAVGHLAHEHMEEMIQSSSQREKLRSLYAAAAADVGAEKAMRGAIKDARMAAEVACDMSKRPRRPAVDVAEEVIREMITVTPSSVPGSA